MHTNSTTWRNSISIHDIPNILARLARPPRHRNYSDRIPGWFKRSIFPKNIRKSTRAHMWPDWWNSLITRRVSSKGTRLSLLSGEWRYNTRIFWGPRALRESWKVARSLSGAKAPGSAGLILYNDRITSITCRFMNKNAKYFVSTKEPCRSSFPKNFETM